jgi:hypothetical protein
MTDFDKVWWARIPPWVTKTFLFNVIQHYGGPLPQDMFQSYRGPDRQQSFVLMFRSQQDSQTDALNKKPLTNIIQKVAVFE